MPASGPPRGFHALSGVDPRNSKPCTYRIEVALLDKVLSRDAAKSGSLRSLRDTILHPERAWQGLNRDDQPDGLALMSRPRAIYFDTGDHHFTLAPPGMGFFVYCSASLLIHDWGWVDFQKEDRTRGVVKALFDPKTAEDDYCLRTFNTELQLPR